MDSSGKANLADRAYSVLKSRLIRLELPPGSIITEATLAAELGISKTPIREALARLRRERLVEPMARFGYRVSLVTLKDVHELFAVRVLLEGEAAALAAGRMSNPADLRQLDDLCRTSYDAGDADSIATFLAANREFHATVARAGQNDHLADLLEQVVDQLERVFHLSLAVSSRASEIVHEHKDLVDAIMAGDAARARDVAVSQIRASQKMVLDALLASPALMSASIVPYPGPRPAPGEPSARGTKRSPARRAESSARRR